MQNEVFNFLLCVQIVYEKEQLLPVLYFNCYSFQMYLRTLVLYKNLDLPR